MADSTNNSGIVSDSQPLSKAEQVIAFLRSDKYTDDMTNPAIMEKVSRLHKTRISEQYIAQVRKDFRAGKYNQPPIALKEVPVIPSPELTTNGTADRITPVAAKETTLYADILQNIKEVHTLAVKCGGLDNLIFIATELKTMKD